MPNASQSSCENVSVLPSPTRLVSILPRAADPVSSVPSAGALKPERRQRNPVGPMRLPSSTGPSEKLEDASSTVTGPTMGDDSPPVDCNDDHRNAPVSSKTPRAPTYSQ